jgi:D-lactate dehydrogenase
MRIALYETEDWEREHLAASALGAHELTFSSSPLQPGEGGEAVEAISVFIYSPVNAATLAGFPRLRLVATRSTGFNHIDLEACHERGVTVCNVPYYGENTVAEHTFGLILARSRKIHMAYMLVRRENVVITPHMASFSAEAQQRILDTTIANIEAFLQAAPQNVVPAST